MLQKNIKKATGISYTSFTGHQQVTSVFVSTGVYTDYQCIYRLGMYYLISNSSSEKMFPAISWFRYLFPQKKTPNPFV